MCPLLSPLLNNLQNQRSFVEAVRSLSVKVSSNMFECTVSLPGMPPLIGRLREPPLWGGLVGGTEK